MIDPDKFAEPGFVPPSDAYVNRVLNRVLADMGLKQQKPPNESRECLPADWNEIAELLNTEAQNANPQFIVPFSTISSAAKRRPSARDDAAVTWEEIAEELNAELKQANGQLVVPAPGLPFGRLD